MRRVKCFLLSVSVPNGRLIWVVWLSNSSDRNGRPLTLRSFRRNLVDQPAEYGEPIHQIFVFGIEQFRLQ